MKQLLSIILIIAMLAVALSSCAPADTPALPSEEPIESESGALAGEPVYVTLDLGCENAEISANLLLAYSNAPAKLPTPTRESYVFAGWFKKWNYTEPCEEGEIFTENITLFAKWDYVSPEMESMTDPVTVEYITFGGPIASLPTRGCAVESGTAVFHQNPKRENYVFEGWYFDREYKNAAYNMKVTEDTRLFAKWRPKYKTSEMTLPIITVNTESGGDILDRKNYEGCSVNVFDSDYTTVVANASAQIRGRGNSTWTQFEKKSFRLKFDEKTDLFGILHRHTLGNKFTKNQRNERKHECNGNDHHAVKSFKIKSRALEELHDRVSKVTCRKRGTHKARQGNGNLNGSKESCRLFLELGKALGFSVTLLCQLGQLGIADLQNSNFSTSKDRVQNDKYNL